MAQFFWTQLSSEYFIQFLTRWVFVDLMDRQNGVLAYNVKNLRSFLKVIWLQRRYVPYRKMLQEVMLPLPDCCLFATHQCSNRPNEALPHNTRARLGLLQLGVVMVNEGSPTRD